MKSVLIVNKDDKSTRVLSSALKRKGYAVKHSRTSNDALRVSDQLNPDIVILHNLNSETDEVGAAKMILQPGFVHSVFVFVSKILADNQMRELNTHCDVIGRHYAVYPKPMKVGRLLKEIKRW